MEEPLRATRLREACKQVELLLTNLKFRLLDLRSKQGGRTQLFHDRYILVFDELGEVEAGYHLSNSIQGATKKYPLLITPIPKDLLTAVKDYVGSLLALPDDSPTELITLFFSVNRPETSFFEKEQHRLATIPHSNFFFASLLHNEKLSSLNEVELNSHLQSFGLLTKEDSTFAVTDQIDSYLNCFTQKLLISNTVDFAKLWAAFGSWLACLPDSDEYLSKVITGGGQNLVLKIQQFLFDAPEQKLPIGSLGAGHNADLIRIIDLILRDFKKGLREDGYLLKIADWHSWRYYSPAWPSTTTCKGQ